MAYFFLQKIFLRMTRIKVVQVHGVCLFQIRQILIQLYMLRPNIKKKVSFSSILPRSGNFFLCPALPLPKIKLRSSSRNTYLTCLKVSTAQVRSFENWPVLRLSFASWVMRAASNDLSIGTVTNKFQNV